MAGQTEKNVRDLLVENKKLRAELREKSATIDYLVGGEIKFSANDTPGIYLWNDLFYEMDCFIGTTDFEDMLLFSSEMAELVRKKNISKIAEILCVYNKFKSKKSTTIHMVLGSED